MSRYIDADKLKENFIGVYEDEINFSFDGYAIKCIDEAPSIDIVRCGECKWRKAKMMPKSVECLFSGNADDFCSYGERREP